MIHELKCRPPFFMHIALGRKKFEIRKNDRNYRVGDILHLKEYDPETDTYSGQNINREVLYLLQGGQFGIEPGYVVMSI